MWPRTSAAWMTLADALALVAARGRLMGSAPGRRLDVGRFADETTVAAAIADLGDGVSIASLNGPDNTVISGKVFRTGRRGARGANAIGVETRPLTTSHAFIRPHGNHIVELTATSRTDEPCAHRAGCAAMSRTSWHAWPATRLRRRPTGEHLRRAVSVADGMATLGGPRLQTVFIEIGPSPTALTQQMGQGAIADNRSNLAYQPERTDPTWRAWRPTLAELWMPA